MECSATTSCNPGPSGPLGALLLRCASGSVGHVDQLQKVLAANTEILGWPCWEVSEALASRRVPMNKSNNLRKERWHRYQINFKLGQCDWTFLAFPPVFIALNMFRRTWNAGAPVDPEPRVTSRDGHVERDHVWLLLQKWVWRLGIEQVIGGWHRD